MSCVGLTSHIKRWEGICVHGGILFSFTKIPLNIHAYWHRMRASEIITKKISFFLIQIDFIWVSLCCVCSWIWARMGSERIIHFLPLPKEIKARKIDTCTTDPAAFWAFSFVFSSSIRLMPCLPPSLATYTHSLCIHIFFHSR